MIGATWRRLWVRALVLSLLVTQAQPAFAYLKFGMLIGGEAVTLKWRRTPVRYSVRNVGITGVTPDALQAAVSRAFRTWEDVPTATITYAFESYTAALPGEDDGRSTLGFLYEPGLDRVLASTSFLIDELTGDLIESDIFFNSAFRWSTAAQGDPSAWDLESIALHEIGHMSGLGHSAIGETTQSGSGRRVTSSGAAMFPIALGEGNILGRRLESDDIAGISDIYPTAEFTERTGSISGAVTRNGRGIFGAHVVAISVATGEMVSNFTLNDEGRFSIAGLSPGPHIVRVEPLDDADVESFFELDGPLDRDFNVKYHERLAIVPRGGDSGALRVQVQRK
jgi:hypothetical protein